MRRLIWYFLIVVFLPDNGQAYDIVINELMARNDTTACDQNGEFDDWIELYNVSSNPVGVGGYCLSDRDNFTMFWALPDTTIPANGYLIVWADEDGTQAGLHACFKLSASGDAVFLSAPDSSLIDSISFGIQTADISYGRFPNGTGGFRELIQSFGSANLFAGPVYNDLTNVFFSDTTVHRFRLHFYIDDWQDTLGRYYDLGESEYLPAQLVCDDSLVLDSIGVRFKGNSSYTLSSSTPKKPFEFNFSKYREDQELMGLHKLNVQNGISDPTFMREAIAYGIARRYMPASRTTYANVYIDSTLLGFYSIVEQMDKIFLSRYFVNINHNLFKASNNGGTLEYRGADPASYAAEYDLKTNEDANDWTRFVELLDKLNNTSDQEFVEKVGKYLNFDRCLRMLAFNMVLSNYDSYTGSSRNYYLYDDKSTTGQFHVMPWDLNESFGVYTNNWNVTTQDILVVSNLDARPLNRRILAVDSLRQIYFDYIAEMIDGPANSDSVSAQIARLRPFIESYVVADSNKVYSYAMFQNNIDNNVYNNVGKIIPGLKSFSVARNAALRSQLATEIVHPGDCDNNGVVDAFDILPVGVYFHRSGTARSTVDYTWSPRRVSRWSSRPAMYADANGDGIVDECDIVAIGINWGFTHIYSTDSYPIDSEDEALLLEHRATFDRIYRALPAGDETYRPVKLLLESIFGFTTATVVPYTYALEQNYPNPFNAGTVIRFLVPERQQVSITVYNALGQVVWEPVHGQSFEAGKYSISMQSTALANGIYFYRMDAGTFHSIRKLAILK